MGNYHNNRPRKKSVLIEEKDIFSIVLNEKDSGRLEEEFTLLMNDKIRMWDEELSGASNLTLKFKTEKVKSIIYQNYPLTL